MLVELSGPVGNRQYGRVEGLSPIYNGCRPSTTVVPLSSTNHPWAQVPPSLGLFPHHTLIIISSQSPRSGVENDPVPHGECNYYHCLYSIYLRFLLDGKFCEGLRITVDGHLM